VIRIPAAGIGGCAHYFCRARAEEPGLAGKPAIPNGSVGVHAELGERKASNEASYNLESTPFAPDTVARSLYMYYILLFFYVKNFFGRDDKRHFCSLVFFHKLFAYFDCSFFGDFGSSNINDYIVGLVFCFVQQYKQLTHLRTGQDFEFIVLVVKEEIRSSHFVFIDWAKDVYNCFVVSRQNPGCVNVFLWRFVIRGGQDVDLLYKASLA
jgi:hypothetical protein